MADYRLNAGAYEKIVFKRAWIFHAKFQVQISQSVKTL